MNFLTKSKKPVGILLLGLIVSSCFTLLAFEYSFSKKTRAENFKTELLDEVLLEMEFFHKIPLEKINNSEVKLTKSKQKNIIPKRNFIPVKAIEKKQSAPLNDLANEKIIKPNLTLKIPKTVPTARLSELDLSAYPHFVHCKNEDPVKQYQCTQNAILNFLINHTRYPDVPRQLQIEGTVHVSFIIDPNGKVKNCSLMRSIDKDLDSEALRVVRKLPDFEPGKQNGQAVNVRFELPIRFKLAKN